MADGAAYYCDCTKDDIAARNPTGGYDGFCRDRGLGPGPGRALRFRTPDEGETVVHDVIRGDVVFENATLEDFVVLRGGGEPMFILANAVDDADMRITHVLRGEDLLSSTPKVLLLRHALGYDPADDPLYGHLPVIVNEKRQKLSKRRDDVALEEFRERGYLPEAMRNYLALLGWGPPDGREILPVADMVAEFRLEDVKPSPAFFDVQKLDHVNAEYIRALPVHTFVRDALPWLEEDPPWPPENFDLATFEAVAPLVQERVRTLSEVPGVVDFLFLDQPVDRPEAVGEGRAQGEGRGRPAGRRRRRLRGAARVAAPALHQATLAVGEAHGLKLGKAQAPIRVAVTGRTVGPPLFESLTALGRERTLERVARGDREARAALMLAYPAVKLGLKLVAGVIVAGGALPRRHLRPGLPGRPAATRPSRPRPSSCSAPPSTTASRRRCWPPASTTPSSCTRPDLAPVVVVTGGNQPGDRFTEAAASANYLLEHGVPDERRPAGGVGHVVVAVAGGGVGVPRRARHQRGPAGVRPLPLPAHLGHGRRAGPRRPRLAHPHQPHRGPDRDASTWPGRRWRWPLGRIIGFRRQANVERVVRDQA